MSSSERPSQKYKRLTDYLDADLDDVPAGEEPVAIDRDAILATARQRAGRLRFLRARAEMETAKAHLDRARLSDEVVRKARAILDLIVQGDPASREKYSLAFRSGKALPDSEVLSILSEFQSLGHDLDAIAVKLKD